MSEYAKGILPLVEGMAAGRTLQFWTGHRWADARLGDRSDLPTTAEAVALYRLKPEPKVVWVNEYSNSFGNAHPTKESAENAAKHAAGIVRVAVRFVEAGED